MRVSSRWVIKTICSNSTLLRELLLEGEAVELGQLRFEDDADRTGVWRTREDTQVQ
jgi:hypothetical protein